MSKRAEKAALKAYPKKEAKVYSTAFGTIEFDQKAPERKGFIRGYEQAVKDIALTAKDVQAIFKKVRDLQFQYCATDGCYQEVADWFNELKQKND